MVVRKVVLLYLFRSSSDLNPISETPHNVPLFALLCVWAAINKNPANVGKRWQDCDGLLLCLTKFSQWTEWGRDYLRRYVIGIV